MLDRLPGGLALGSSYALLAVGFTLVFGVLRQLNLAYGATIMLGIYLAMWMHQQFQFNAMLMAPLVIAVTIAAGIYIERFCFAPHAGRAAVTSMAATFAAWMQLQEFATLLLPQHANAFPSPFENAEVAIGVAELRLEHLVAIGSGAAIAVGLWHLLYRTRFGLAVRATIENRQAAACVGINVPRISLLIFSLASALGGLAGYLIVSVDGRISPMFAMWATLKGMIAAVLGGLGSLGGAVAGGLLLGVLETCSQSLLGPQYRELCSYLLLFVLLWLCPAGLSVLWPASTRPGLR